MVSGPKDPWRIHFFQRHIDDDAARVVPSIDFLDGLPDKVAAEIHAVLDAVADDPPPSFSGGGKWEAMHARWLASMRSASRAAGRTIGSSAFWSAMPKTSVGRASCASAACRSRRGRRRISVTTA